MYHKRPADLYLHCQGHQSITKQENTLFPKGIKSCFFIVGSPSHEFIIIAFYDEGAELVAVTVSIEVLEI